jgi:hypothetical protein
MYGTFESINDHFVYQFPANSLTIIRIPIQ